MNLRAALRTPRGVGVAVVAIATFAVGFVPLFAGPGYEHAIASGLIVPTVAAVVSANEGFVDRHALAPESPLVLLGRAVERGVLLAAVAVATALIHGLRVGFCDPLGGLATFGLTAGTGTVLASVVGATTAVIVGHLLPMARRRRRVAAIVAGVAPLATALVAGAYFYFTPAVFAFDPFVGFFSGTLYDEVVDAYRPLLTYRAGTALTIGAIAGLFAAVARSAEGRLSLVRRREAVLGAALALGSATLVFYGKELGHRSGSDFIRTALGAERHGARCDVVHPRKLTEAEAALLARDCDEQLAAVERRLGFAGPERVTAFFFKDAEQKRVLMGAADTYVAKPWRREVYLQLGAYPHPVLGHELAHVVAGAVARGPFKVAARFGLLPNPGLIEGIAVAASPDRDELTPAQWALAMKRLGIIPPLSRTFGSGFLAQNSSMAYTLAGAFVTHQLARGRAGAVRAWYGGVTFEQAFGEPFGAAEQEWLGALDLVALPDAALAVAKARFDRPAIWGRRCPHVVEKLRDEAEACRDEGDLKGADRKLAALLALDTADPAARLERARLAAKTGDLGSMRATVQAMIADERVSVTFRNRAREALGDEALRRGLLDEARSLFDAARLEVLDDDLARNLDVKSFLTTTPARAALFGRLLVGRPEPLASKDEALAATIAIARFVEQGGAVAEDRALARYLLVRRLIDLHAWDDANAMLSTVDVGALAQITPRLQRETARLAILLACVSEPAGRAARVGAALARYREMPPPNAGRREAIERFAERCAR